VHRPVRSNALAQEGVQRQGRPLAEVATPILDAVGAHKSLGPGTGIRISPGDDKDPGIVMYRPGMGPVGHPFVDAAIEALDALLYGPGADPEGPQTDIADVHIDVFADPRQTGTGDKVRDPEAVHRWVQHPGVNGLPAWRDQVDAQRVGFSGNVVADYLHADPQQDREAGRFSKKTITICHADLNGGHPEWLGGPEGTLYWLPDVGMAATSGPDDGLVAPPAITLRHELTHAWIDHRLDLSIVSDAADAQFRGMAFDRQQNATLTDEQRRAGADPEREGQLDYDALRDLWDPDRELDLNDAQFAALVNAQVAYPRGIDADRFLVPPTDLETPHHTDTGVVGFNEEELNTDLDYEATHRMIDWARENAPELLEEGGPLGRIGNRSEYNEWKAVPVEGPLSTR